MLASSRGLISSIRKEDSEAREQVGSAYHVLLVHFRSQSEQMQMRGPEVDRVLSATFEVQHTTCPSSSPRRVVICSLGGVCARGLDLGRREQCKALKYLLAMLPLV
jgi:hypothetical protein